MEEVYSIQFTTPAEVDVEIDLKGKENIIADALFRVSPQLVHESKIDRDLPPFKNAY